MSHVIQHSIHRTIRTLVVFGGVIAAAFLLGIFNGTRSSAQNANTVTANAMERATALWHEATPDPSPDLGVDRTVPRKYRSYHLDAPAMDAAIKSLSSAAGKETLEIPMPDGSLANFRVTEAPVVEKGLADKYPFLQTFRGQGVDDPSTTLRFDFMNGTFRAMVLSPRGIVLVDPHPDAGKEVYMSYFLGDSSPPNTTSFCPTELGNRRILKEGIPEKPMGRQVFAGDVQRTYVIAIGTTAQWTDLMGGGTLAGGLARVVSILNRIDLIYERDLAIHLVLAANNDRIIFVGGSPYNNNDLRQMMTQNKNILRARLSGYDFGHAFGTKTTGNIAGVALGVGLTCGPERESAASKITADTGFDLLTSVHEIGHQMGADHTFNTADRSPQSAFEPSSGFSIMSHGGDGIFGSFHLVSVEQILDYTQAGTGRVCGTDSPTGNTIPSVSAPSGFNIPKQTPFSLTATASDADGDTLTYAWQEFDRGAVSPPDTDADGSPRPILRAFDPVSVPTRYFPSLPFVRNNANVPPQFSTCNGLACLTLESLPNITRTMQFQVLVRDNRSGAGAINSTLSVVNVDGGSGPFVVTSPNTGIDTQTGMPLTVTWDVANTTDPPVNAATVDIRLSSDGGQTFPVTLADATANDGVESVILPNVVSRRTRIMVIGHGNIFFDMSDTNFAINDCPPNKCGPLEITPTASSITRGGGVAFDSSGGTGGHNFSIVENSSNGTIDTASGFFTAGPGVGVDVIRVTDALGATADATVTTAAACVAAERTWDGGGSTLNWSDAANWTCDEVPEATGETVIFDVTSHKNVTIDIPVTIPSLKIANGYTGTITIADGVDLTITDVGGFVLSDGTLNGGSGTITAPTFAQDGGTFNGGIGNMVISQKLELIARNFNAPSGNLDIFGSFSTTPASVFSPGDGTVRFLGDGAGAITIDGGVFNNVTLDSTGPRSLTGQIISFATFRLIRGAFSGGSISSSGSLVIESGYDDNTNSPPKITVGGNGSGTYLNNGGITPRGEWVVDGVLTLNSNLDLSVNNGSPLRLLSGRIITGDFKVNAGTRNIIRTNGHIVGNLRRDFSTTGAKVFDVGIGGQRSPLTVTVLAPISGTQGMTVGISAFPDPNMNPVTSLQCHWNLTEHGNVTANLTFTYLDGCDLNGIENQASVAKVSGGVVSFTADPINTAANNFTIQNETDFASYSIGVDPSPCPSGQRLWDGGGTTNNWSEAANWACDLVPQNGNNIVLDATSVKNIVIDVPISVNLFRINAGFTGNVTLASTSFSAADFLQSDGMFNGVTSSINVTGGFTQSGGTFNGGSGPITVSGAFNLTGGSFSASSNSTSFTSNFKHTGGAFDHNGGTVIFGGNAASGINQGLPVTTVETFNNLTFQRTGIVILKVNGIMNVLGNLNLSSGQIQQDVLGSSLNANGDVAVGSDYNGLIPLSHVGSVDQTVTITGSPLAPWRSWVVDKPAGKVRLASNLQWPGGLQSFAFTNGKIDTGNFVLDLGQASGFAQNGYVIGNLRKTFFGAATFEVGTDSGSSPVSIAQGFGFVTFTVRANDGVPAGVNPATSIRRNWTITSGGSASGDLTLQYVDADVPAGANEGNFKFIRQSGSQNQVFEPTAFDTALNTFTLSGVTEFSTWTLGQLIPTAAAVEISGRVSTPIGSGISRASITITDQSGNARTVFTNPFGYYVISNVVAGRSYILSVKTKGHSFASGVRVVTVDDYISGLDFISDN